MLCGRFLFHTRAHSRQKHTTPVRVTSSGQSHKTSSQGKMGKAVLHSTKRKPSSFWWMIGSSLQRLVPESKSKDWRALLQLACLQDKLLTWYILVWRMKKKIRYTLDYNCGPLWTTTALLSKMHNIIFLQFWKTQQHRTNPSHVHIRLLSTSTRLTPNIK